MNLEHFQQRVKCKKQYLEFIASNARLFNLYVQYQKEIKDYLKSQLRYGSLTFEIIEHSMYNIPLYQEVNIKYTRQIHNPQINDSTLYDYFRQKKFKRTGTNLISLLITFLLLCVFLYIEFYRLYCVWFPDIALRSPIYDLIFKNSFYLISDLPFFNFLNFKVINFFFIELIINFSTHFNLIF